LISTASAALTTLRIMSATDRSGGKGSGGLNIGN
jgi:hypothetical protein